MTEPARARLGTAWLAGPTSSRWVRRLLSWVAVLVVATGGAAIGWQLAPPTNTTIGPFTVRADVVLSAPEATTLDLPPAGQVGFDTHRGPFKIRLSLESVDLDGAGELIGSRQALNTLVEEAPAQLRAVVTRAGLTSIGCAVLGAAIAGLLVYRRPRLALACAGLPLAAGAVAAVLAVTSFTPRALNEPHFTGLLSRAPYLTTQGVAAVDRLQSYRSGVADMVQAVSLLYTTSGALPQEPGPGVVTVLHVSDIHLNPQAYDLIGSLQHQFGVDAVVDTGDITTWGTTAESSTLAPIGALGVPYVFVRGNHDSPETGMAVAAFPNAVVLDGNGATVAGLRMVGVSDPSFTPDGEPTDPDVGRRAGQSLADAIAADEAAGHTVDIGLVHNPTGLDPVLGEVPLVLAGHLHRFSDRLDPSGTRVMVEGSTGGAGITSGALRSVEDGRPTPLSATLLYFGAPGGARAGQLVAYDHVTVGGLGLASVSIERTVIPAEAEADGEPTPASPTATVPGQESVTDSTP